MFQQIRSWIACQKRGITAFFKGDTWELIKSILLLPVIIVCVIFLLFVAIVEILKELWQDHKARKDQGKKPKNL